MDKIEWGLKDFATETVTIKEVFLTRAIEDFVIAQKYNRFALDHPNNVVKYHYAISSLVFSFLFIDNLLTYYYKELFSHLENFDLQHGLNELSIYRIFV